MQSKSALVRSTTAWVMSRSNNVKINHEKLTDLTKLIELN